MDLLIIRHGESEADILNVHEGRADFSLTGRGRRQAQAMAEYVANRFCVERIYASTLQRALQTAQYLSDAVHVPIVPEDILMEFNNGLLAGLSYAEADRRYPKVENLPPDQSVYGQETRIAFRDRAETFLRRILREQDSNSCVAVVSHGGFIDQMYGAMLSLPVDKGVYFPTGDTGIHVWQIRGDVVRLVHANLTDHTRGI